MRARHVYVADRQAQLGGSCVQRARFPTSATRQSARARAGPPPGSVACHARSDTSPPRSSISESMRRRAPPDATPPAGPATASVALKSTRACRLASRFGADIRHDEHVDVGRKVCRIYGGECGSIVNERSAKCDANRRSRGARFRRGEFDGEHAKCGLLRTDSDFDDGDSVAMLLRSAASR